MDLKKLLKNFLDWSFSNPNKSGVFIFTIIFTAVVIIASLRYDIIDQKHKDEMSILLENIHENLEENIKNAKITCSTLALTINDDGIPKNFNKIAKEQIELYPFISSINIALDGNIKYVYPLKNNEAELKATTTFESSHVMHDLFNSIENKKGFISHPIQLTNGEIIVINTLPIYKNNSFWGFTSANINLKKILNNSSKNLVDFSKYELRLSILNTTTKKEKFYFSPQINPAEDYYVRKTLPNITWTFFLIDKNPHNIQELLQWLLGSGFGLIFAIIIGFFTTKLLRQPEKLRTLLEEQREKILTNELMFQTVYDQATIGFAFVDALSGKFIKTNNKYCAILGYTHEEIKDKSFVFFTHPDDIADNLSNLKKLEEGIIREYTTDKRYINKSGEIIWINLTVSPMWESNKTPTTNIAFIKDITAFKESQLIIEKNEAKLKSLIDTVDGIVWECYLKNQTTTFISKKVEKILGYTVEDYMGSPTFWEDHIYPEDRDLALSLSSIVNMRYKDHDYEYRMVSKDGKIVWIRDIVNFIFEKGTPVTARGIMIDITTIKEAEIDFKKSYDLVLEQNKRLLNFSHIISHNLRSHTSNIESLLSLIETSETEEERNKMLKLLSSVSNSLDETMTHLNEVVNINTNINLVIQPLDFSKYIIKAQETLNEQIKFNQVTFIVDIPDDPLIDYNKAYLESILYNLISNAIRYKHPQQKPIITIKLYKENNINVFEVSDNGIGIDLKKNSDKLFGMYKTFSNNPDARGIGLFITKSQIESMGGQITVESEINIGTKFKIYTK